jgi:hypothetical protein
MKGERFDITYAAHTATCTFLLDAEGICRHVVVLPAVKRRTTEQNAARCIGAQYVATLDPTVPGCLVEMPKVGTPMLFARVGERGRVTLVRTGPVTSFETKRADDPDPFKESIGVVTSAPAARDLHGATPRLKRAAAPSPSPAASPGPAPVKHDPYQETAERTQAPPNLREDREEELDDPLLVTDEYDSNPPTLEAKVRHPWPAAPGPHGRTLHDPHVPLSPVEDPEDPYVESAYARTRERRTSEPVPKRTTPPIPLPSVSIRRRG